MVPVLVHSLKQHMPLRPDTYIGVPNDNTCFGKRIGIDCVYHTQTELVLLFIFTITVL